VHVRDGPTKALGRILATSGVRLQQQLPETPLIWMDLSSFFTGDHVSDALELGSA
jgi:hypothetical protein